MQRTTHSVAEFILYVGTVLALFYFTHLAFSTCFLSTYFVKGIGLIWPDYRSTIIIPNGSQISRFKLNYKRS